MIPSRKKIRRQPAIKNLGRVGDVKCWFDKQSKSICFRRKKSKRVDSISLGILYDKVAGQILMPFV